MQAGCGITTNSHWLSAEAMADHKNQHYVPKCHLKPFSLNGCGKAINLYASTQQRLIRNAAVKSQCARDYFYGTDGEIESGLAEVEGEYAEAVRNVVAGTDTDRDLDLLRYFAYLQLRRTEVAVTRMKQAEDAMLVDVPEHIMPPDTVENIMIASLQMCAQSQPLVTDLKVRIIENKTEVEFVTSDDPAVSTSKWMSQRKGAEGFGVMSSGFLLMMPLTPKLAVFCYDGLVYTVPSLVGGRILIKKSADAEALNELHYLKSAANIYFSTWDFGDHVRERFEKARPRRINDWFVTRYYMPVESDGSEQVWKEVTLDETQVPNSRSIVRTTFRYPIPSAWLSHLKYRNPIRTFYNGSAVGHVRKQEWLEG
jgi:hypothetical protein